ncbi:MAG TPA: hypothetical protein VFE90_22315, partial [Myxococcales bacterium]|nr:hypothetical protein [Myxococcales bacterium]
LTPILHRADMELRGKPVDLVATARTRADIAEVVVRQNGHLAPYFFGSPLEVEVLLSPETAQAEGRLLLEGAVIESAVANTPGKLAFSIPADQLRVLTRFTVALAGGEAGSDRRRDLRVPVEPGQSLTLVAFEPAVLGEDGESDAVSAEEIQQILDAARTLGFAVQLVELPFVDDALAVLARPLASSGDPKIAALLEALSLSAMRSRGFEDALWVAVVRRPFGAVAAPPPVIELAAFVRARVAPPRTWVSLPAEGARAVAVASLNGLPELIASTFPSTSLSGLQARDRIAADRLRLLGRLLPGERVVMETPRQEHRGTGPGSPVATGLTAVALDGNGRELLRTPLRAVSVDRPTVIAELLPVTPEMRRVEVRRDDGTQACAFTRLSGLPKLTGVSVADGELKWTYQHPDGAVPALSVELVRRFGDEGGPEEISVPFLTLDACGNAARLPRTRVRSADAVRLVASDGWNAVEIDAGESSILNHKSLVLRRLGSGGFWGDATGVAVDAWNVNGVAQLDDQGNAVRTPVVHLQPDLRGIIAVAAGEETDRRDLGDDDA